MRKLTGKQVLLAIVAGIIAVVVTLGVLVSTSSTDYYEIVYTDHNDLIENYHLVLHVTDTSKAHYEDYIKEIEEELSYKAKNIYVYKDTTSALYELEIRNKKTAIQNDLTAGTINQKVMKKQIEAIDKETYVKRADGMMMILDNTLNNTSKIFISWYPLRDFKYKELKNGK